MRYLTGKNEPDEAKQTPGKLINAEISAKINENLAAIKILLNACSDVVIKEFVTGREKDIKGLLIYFDGLTNRLEIEDFVIKPLLKELNQVDSMQVSTQHNLFNDIKERILTIAELSTISNLQELCHHINSGDTVLLIDGFKQGLVAGTRFWQGRSIETPENESVISGPKEGFNETLRANTALLRRRLKSTSFKIESLIIGKITKTDVALCYIEDIAPPNLITEVRERLKSIDIDGILDTGYLEEFLEDKNNFIFSQVEYTEKPDRVCGHLLEGKITIIVDGSPMALILPTAFPYYIVSAEDYYERFLPASLYRLLRFFAFSIALLLPALYVAIITYHHEMIPPSLYLTIASSREGVPFSAFVEALVLELTFELLREASLRLPGAIGPAVSIVGALIIGDASVKAGLVSTPMVVVVAFTGIASFITPSYNAGIIIRISRFGMLIAGATLGILGIVIAILFMLLKMASLNAFGQPYLSPMAPLNIYELTDVLIRRPWPRNIMRPNMKGMKNRQRQNISNSSKSSGDKK